MQPFFHFQHLLLHHLQRDRPDPGHAGTPDAGRGRHLPGGGLRHGGTEFYVAAVGQGSRASATGSGRPCPDPS